MGTTRDLKMERRQRMRGEDPQMPELAIETMSLPHFSLLEDDEGNEENSQTKTKTIRREKKQNYFCYTNEHERSLFQEASLLQSRFVRNEISFRRMIDSVIKSDRNKENNLRGVQRQLQSLKMVCNLFIVYNDLIDPAMQFTA